jgi:hypothetical protein
MRKNVSREEQVSQLVVLMEILYGTGPLNLSIENNEDWSSIVENVVLIGAQEDQ